MSVNQEKLNASLRFLDKMGERNLEQLKATDPAAAQQMEKIGKLFSDMDFDKQLLACTENQAMVKLFAEHGVTMQRRLLKH